jgi:hypothetical protein
MVHDKTVSRISVQVGVPPDRLNCWLPVKSDKKFYKLCKGYEYESDISQEQT